jgi:hypothetical protein
LYLRSNNLDRFGRIEPPHLVLSKIVEMGQRADLIAIPIRRGGLLEDCRVDRVGGRGNPRCLEHGKTRRKDRSFKTAPPG